jgi:tRNA(Ile)-lysidine synthase TilS/MesJ
MNFHKHLEYLSWRKQESEILDSLGGKEVWLLFSGGKDSTLAFYFLYMAAQDFKFNFQVHAGAFPKHRYNKPERDRIHSFWLEKGFNIHWHNIHDSDDALDEAPDPCLVCQRLRKQLLFDVVRDSCNNLEDLVIVINYDLSDLVSYTLEYLTGSIYSDNGNGQCVQKRFTEVSHRFYPVLKMDQGYTIYRPILRYNEQDVIKIVKEASIPILTVPCRYAKYRPKRTLAAYYEAMGLHFDYDKVFDFAKNRLGLLSAGGYASMKQEDYLKKVF